MSTKYHPGTHCPACGEVLSQYGGWQYHYPPMNLAQEANASPALPRPAAAEVMLALSTKPPG